MLTMKIQETQLCLGPRGEVVMEFLPLKQLSAFNSGKRSHPFWKILFSTWYILTFSVVSEENVGHFSCEQLTNQRKDVSTYCAYNE